ncbi:MAG: ankyrin repeat-containing protein [Acidobacteria bacterium OLB17]|nr:MAG: ankyrin repeat-containing protein [Acidobacteria bacterium OLB17]MCZ2390248.1 tetratricopeptide repeat protein [Acidobacteriota bacterium]
MIDKGELDAAAARIEAVLKTRPNDLKTLSQKVRLLVIKKQFAETEALANRIIARDPKNKIALNARGVAKRDGRKDFAGALADFDKALAIDAEYPQASFNRAITLYSGKLGKKSEALDAFSSAIEINPENATARAMRGRLFNEFGRYKLALLDLNKALALNKGLPIYADRAYAQLLLYVAGDRSVWQNAANDAETALRADPSNATALAIRSLVKFSRSDKTGSAADAQKAFEIDPNNYLTRMALGYVKRLNKDLAGAFDEFEAAYKIVPNSTWVVDDFFEAARQAKDTYPKAAAAYRELSARKITRQRERVELLKLAVADDPWDHGTYDKLEKAWSNLLEMIEKANDRNTWTPDGKLVTKEVPEYDVERKASRNYWYDLHAKSPKNVCVGYFKYGFLDTDANGAYGENYKKSDSFKLNYLKGELANYDGKNGAECAARVALYISGLHNLTYSPSVYDAALAKQFAERSKQIKADLKDDPNTVDGAGSTAEEALNNIAYWKAQDDSWKKDLERMKQSGTSSDGGSVSGRRSGIDPAKERAAIAAYERVHPQIERLAEQIISAAGKVQSGGSMSFLYRGTRQRITNLQRQMVDIYYKFIEVHGPNLPDSLLNHLRSDVSRVGNLRNDYTTGEAYVANGACSNGWSGYGC